MLLWAAKNSLHVSTKLSNYRDRLMGRASVQKAMTHEGLI
jgi:glutathione S-transferase